MIKRRVAGILVFLLSTAISPASAAVSVGTACNSIGSKATVKGAKLICVQTGAGKVWNKENVTKTSTKSSEPVEPKSFDDLIPLAGNIPYWAWKKSSSVIQGASDGGPELIVRVGPNTTKPTTKEADAIRLATRLFSGFKQPERLYLIYYNFKDINWGQEEFAKIALRPVGTEAKNMCQTVTTCWGAVAEIDYLGNAVILMGTNSPKNVDINHSSGSLEAHEYFHAIQATQFVGSEKEFNTYCCVKTHLPHWFVEGPATWVQAASVYHKTFKNYLTERARTTNDFVRNSDGKFTKSWIEKFINPESRDMWMSQTGGWRTYDAGFLVTEALVALKGPAALMQLSRDIALGDTWQQAFEKNYGATWDEVAPKLATAVKNQLKK